MVIRVLLIIFLIVISLKILFDIVYILISKEFISSEWKNDIDTKVKILIIIPVLREQNIIEKTLSHFEQMNFSQINLRICVAGTTRERRGRASSYVSTGDVVERWIVHGANHNNDEISFFYSEINECNGDRATQLNWAVKKVTKDFLPDIIGVYDADSLPDIDTLLEVASEYIKNPDVVLQQPVNFIDAANRMAKEKKNPILVANALYQTTWSIIRELPRWYMHSIFCGQNTGTYYRNDYLIGHGEFIPFNIYKRFLFPEDEVTDGIQLGYRLSMSGGTIKPLHSWCADDVPQNIKQLIGQHKRWFGGCNKLNHAYKWCLKNCGRSSVLQMLDGYWSQFSWAYASIVSIVALLLSIYLAKNGEIVFLVLVTMCILFYSYIIPFFSHVILMKKMDVRLIDWIVLPLAILIKGIGPNLYFINRVISFFTKKKIEYSKVER